LEPAEKYKVQKILAVTHLEVVSESRSLFASSVGAYECKDTNAPALGSNDCLEFSVFGVMATFDC